MLACDLQIPKTIFSIKTNFVQAGKCEDDPPFDCGDCRSPIRLAYNSDNITISYSSAYRSNFRMLNLDNGHTICYNNQSTVGVLNKSAFMVASLFDQPFCIADVPFRWREIWGDVLLDKTLMKLIKFDLIVPEGYKVPDLAGNFHILTAWLHITDECNLRCSYCYLPHKALNVSFELGKMSVDAVFRSAMVQGYSHVHLKYAGGEPLLRFPFVVELHQYAKSQADKHGLLLSGSILSNGTCLTPKILDAMNELDLRLMISLDGLGKYHDCQRVDTNGRGSSADVTRAIELALDYGITPYISTIVSGQNVEGLPELIDWILKHDLSFRLGFYRENDFSTSHSELKFEEEQIISGMLAAYKVIEANLPKRNLLSSLADHANLFSPHLRTCSVGQNYLVFNPLGQISKCQMETHKPITNVHTHDPLALIQMDKKGTQNISVEDKEGCKSCEWKYWCSGGCPIVTFRAKKRYNVKSPNCEIYKALYPEIVRLEGLRLLKYDNDIKMH